MAESLSKNRKISKGHKEGEVVGGHDCPWPEVTWHIEKEDIHKN